MDDAFETETDVAVCIDVPDCIAPEWRAFADAELDMLTAVGVVEGGEGGAVYLGIAWEELDEDWLIGLGAVVDDEPVSLLMAPAIFLDMPKTR